MFTLNLLFLVNNHIVTQVVKAQLVVCSVCNVGVVSRLSLLVVNLVSDKTYGKTEVSVELAHPLGVTASEVVVDGNDMNAVACKTVEVCGEGSNKSFTFTCFHLGDTSLMKNDSADNLNGIVLHTEHSVACLTANSKCVGKNIVCSFTVCKAFL